MLIRTLLVTFIGGAMFHSVGFTQNQQSAKFTPAPTVAVVANFSPLIKTKINQAVQIKYVLVSFQYLRLTTSQKIRKRNSLSQHH